MIEWIIENKEWLFSGIAIAIPLSLISWKLSKKGNSKFKQSQITGNNSNNIQARGDITIKNVRNKDD